jgi:S-adenosylmethionine/arginine decarboxylase-like enzyme
MLNNPNPREHDFYGQELILNLYVCDLKTISSGEKIKEYILELCDHVIKMKRYGEPNIPHFGHENPMTSGYSMVQLIETSSVTGHFSEYKKSAYINIFSCAWFDLEKTAQFTQEFFGAKRVHKTLLKRE